VRRNIGAECFKIPAKDSDADVAITLRNSTTLETRAELLAYLLERGGVRGPLLRTSVKRCRLGTHVVCRVVREAAVRAELGERVTPRTLRHSYATHLMDRGVDLAIIASLMGHRSPAETGVYLHALESQPQDAVDALNGHAIQGVQP
jgi:site-specific recombinase XerD